MGYILNLNDDKTLTLKSGKTYVGENNADTIVCYLPTSYKGFDLKDCFVLLHIIIQDLNGDIVGGDVIELKIKDYLYKDKYVSYFDISNTYTANAQTIILKIELLTSDSSVAYTNEVSFPICSNRLTTDSLPDGGISVFDEYLKEIKQIRDECLSILNEIKNDIGSV